MALEEFVKVPGPVKIMTMGMVNETFCEREFREMSMYQFMREHITADGYFGKNHLLVMAAYEIDMKFREAKEGDFVELSADMMVHVKKVLDSPSSPFQPALAKQQVPFFRALSKTFSKDEVAKAKALGAAAADASA